MVSWWGWHWHWQWHKYDHLLDDPSFKQLTFYFNQPSIKKLRTFIRSIYYLRCSKKHFCCIFKNSVCIGVQLTLWVCTSTYTTDSSVERLFFWVVCLIWYWLLGGRIKCQLLHCCNQGLRSHIFSALRHDASINIMLWLTGKYFLLCTGEEMGSSEILCSLG